MRDMTPFDQGTVNGKFPFSRLLSVRAAPLSRIYKPAAGWRVAKVVRNVNPNLKSAFGQGLLSNASLIVEGRIPRGERHCARRKARQKVIRRKNQIGFASTCECDWRISRRQTRETIRRRLPNSPSRVPLHTSQRCISSWMLSRGAGGPIRPKRVGFTCLRDNQ